MRTRNIIAAFALLLAAGQAHAQEATADTLRRTQISTQGDSIIIRRGSDDLRIKVYEKQGTPGESKEVELFDGVYLEKVDADRRTFVDALPFIPKRRRYYFSEHYPVFYFQFDKLSSHNLRYSSPYPARNGRSWEWGINFASHSWTLDMKKHWGITSAIGLAYTKYHFDGNHAFRKADGNTVFTPDEADKEYKKSLLRYFSMRIPVCVEWQSAPQRFYLSAGAELEWRFGMKSKAKFDGSTHTVGKDLNYNPIGANLLLQAGYGDIMLIARFGLTPLMSKSHAPEMYHSSIGIGISM